MEKIIKGAAEYLAAFADGATIEAFRDEARFILRETSAGRAEDRFWDKFWSEEALRYAVDR